MGVCEGGTQGVTIRGWTQGEGTGEGAQGVTIRGWIQVDAPGGGTQRGNPGKDRGGDHRGELREGTQGRGEPRGRT